MRVVEHFVDVLRRARYVREGIGFFRARTRTIGRFVRRATPLRQGIERIVEHFFGPRKQVPVTVEREAHGRVSRSHRNLLRMRAGSDPECDRRVAEVVRPEVAQTGSLRRRHPEATTPDVERHRAALRRREDEIFGRAGERGQMIAQWLRGDPGERDGAISRSSLGRTEVQVTADVDHCFGDRHLAPKDVDPLGSEAEELACPQTPVSGEKHDGLVARVHGGGERVNLGGGEEAHLDAFDPGHPDALARRRWHEAGLDGRSHDLRHQLTCFCHGRRGQAGGGELRDPGAHGHVPDVAQRHRPEVGEEVTLQVPQVSYAARGPQVDRRGAPLLGPVREQHRGAQGVDPEPSADFGLDTREVTVGVGFECERHGSDVSPPEMPVAGLPTTRRELPQGAELSSIAHRNLLSTKRSLCPSDVTRISTLRTV
ncbi:MAG TPA: hypothetical protein VHS97_16405 [Isosphaeraceae bacterium]|nr:hypothetical protein [Isosphaeraceae bacterium]